MAAHELIDQAYLRVANRGTNPIRMRSWLALYCWWRHCAPFLTIPTSGKRNWRGYGTQWHWICSGTFLPGTGAARRKARKEI